VLGPGEAEEPCLGEAIGEAMDLEEAVGVRRGEEAVLRLVGDEGAGVRVGEEGTESPPDGVGLELAVLCFRSALV
jgi:hypothetical protein